MERDPTKRKVKPPVSTLLDFDLSSESSDDSDFRIEDHCNESDDDSLDSDDGETQSGDPSDIDEESLSSEEKRITAGELIEKAMLQKEKSNTVDPTKILICCVCLGDRSDANNEIVECDGCGVTVHEGCYGVSENDSVSSTVSSCSTMPWFCEACRAGVDNPKCELCPNFGGIFKETDTGKWVHLVCALYIPGVAFGEVDKLSCVTLFEMSYSKWGARTCTLCADQRFALTGVCVGCDAGLCRTYFHVTCGQREGLLSEAHSEEVDQADPFYAHCKLHSDKFLIKKRRRNWLALEHRTAQRKEQYAAEGHIVLPEQLRNQRKLTKYRQKYLSAKDNRPLPWVPTQKMGRPLSSSASACRAMWNKATLSGIDTQALALREAQTAALADVHRKWYIPPAFSVEFIGYYLDRNNRLKSMKQQLSTLLEENAKLVDDQQKAQAKYDEALKENTLFTKQNEELRTTLQKYHNVIIKVAPQKELLKLDVLCTPVRNHPLASPLGSVPTLAALKAGVGFPLHQGPPSRGLNEQCGICHRSTDQHLLAKCDTCNLHYHLGCLNPPLTRMPKKTKLMGWQCSECDKESSGSEMECVDPEAPRQLRKVRDLAIEELSPILVEKEPLNDSLEALEAALASPELSPVINNSRPGKKRRREKHHKYEGADMSPPKPHKHKRKWKSVDINDTLITLDTSAGNENRPALKIKFKSIPHPKGGGSSYAVTPGDVYIYPLNPLNDAPGPKESVIATQPRNENRPCPVPATPTTPAVPAKKSKDAPGTILTCHTCNLNGTTANIVRCDECLKGFHFHCLDPPVKKSPKVRGYSWHCAGCDPTESDSN